MVWGMTSYQNKAEGFLWARFLTTVKKEMYWLNTPWLGILLYRWSLQGPVCLGVLSEEQSTGQVHWSVLSQTSLLLCFGFEPAWLLFFFFRQSLVLRIAAYWLLYNVLIKSGLRIFFFFLSVRRVLLDDLLLVVVYAGLCKLESW